MIKSRKGQLSIETMIIYGLIALVALSAVAALIYFDVLNLGRYLPDRCDIGGSGDLKCEEVKVSSTNPQVVEFGIRNVAQKPITNVEIVVSESAGVHLTSSITGTYTANNGVIPPGEIVMVSIPVGAAGTIKKTQVFEASLKTTYKYTDGAITQEASGDMRVKAT